jgi:hypothetical protein
MFVLAKFHREIYLSRGQFHNTSMHLYYYGLHSNQQYQKEKKEILFSFEMYEIYTPMNVHILSFSYTTISKFHENKAEMDLKNQQKKSVS